jgi:hypothetical protein
MVAVNGLEFFLGFLEIGGGELLFGNAAVAIGVELFNERLTDIAGDSAKRRQGRREK